jgi:hypothetical protein
MSLKNDPNNPIMTAGQVLCGYRLVQTAYLETTRTWYYDLEHESTGAKHGH